MLKVDVAFKKNTDRPVIMEETIYLKVDTGMQTSHTEQNFLGREDNFLHSTPKLVVIRKD